jgi:hypothetical protein
VEDQLRRGGLYLHQQYRGADLEAVHLAAPAEQWNETAGSIRANLGVEVFPLGSSHQPVAAVLAVAAVSAAELQPDTNFTFARPRRATAGRSWTLAVVASFVLLTACTLWALFNIATLTRAEASLRDMDRQAYRHYRAVSAMVSTARGRDLALKNIDAMQRVLRENGSLQTAFSSLAVAAPRSVQLDSLEITNEGTSWKGVAVGRVASFSNTTAVRDLSRFSQRLAVEPGFTRVEVEDFNYLTSTEDAESSSGLRFRIVFTMETPL